MKVLVVLSAVLAGCLASPGIGYGYSAILPLTGYGGFAAPYSYAYSAPIISTPYLATPYVHSIAPIAQYAAPLKTQHHSQDELGQAKYGHTEPHQSHEAIQDAHGNKIGSFSYVDPHGGVHRTDYVADSLGYRVASNDLPLAPAGPLPLLHRRRRQAAWNGPAASVTVTPSGHLAETPEVAAARAAHLNEHNRQNVAQPQHQQSWNQPQAAVRSWNQAPATSWNQAPATSWSQPQPASWNQAPATSWSQPQAEARSWSQAPTTNWNQGPATFQQPASVTVTPSGNLADTPEVAAAKAAHFTEFARAASAAAAAPDTASSSGQWQDSSNWNQQQPAQSWNQQQPAQSWEQPRAQSWEQPRAQTWSQPQAAPAQQWSQPQAAPAQQWQQPQATAYSSWQQPQAATWQQQPSWNSAPTGGIPDTPEVAAARAAHLAEHANASRRQ